MTNTESVGGIPLISVIGTPRTMGEHLGSRLKPRLQVLSQFLLDQLASWAQVDGRSLTPKRLRETLRSNSEVLARLEPSLWMELESMAHASGLGAEDLLLIHGYGDLLSHYRCQVPPGRSTFVALGPSGSDTGRPRMALAWHLDPALIPYVTLLRRIPAHGPASLSLTLAGLGPVAGLSEAGIGAAANELRVTDGTAGHLSGYLLASTLTAPSIDDCLSRGQASPRFGGCALHVMASTGERFSLELSGQLTAQLPDPLGSSPRVHCNHALSPQIMPASEGALDASSAARLELFASRAVDAVAASPNAIAGWFGLEHSTAGVKRDSSAARRRGFSPASTVLMIVDPADKQVHLKRGGVPTTMETVRL